MPPTEHDYDLHHDEHDNVNDREHAHYLGNHRPVDLPDLKHGRVLDRVFNYRGDWYAVHTH